MGACEISRDLPPPFRIPYAQGLGCGTLIISRLLGDQLARFTSAYYIVILLA
jgi:hypothetical protein